jgi:hypothetical protein
MAPLGLKAGRHDTRTSLQTVATLTNRLPEVDFEAKPTELVQGPVVSPDKLEGGSVRALWIARLERGDYVGDGVTRGISRSRSAV